MLAMFIALIVGAAKKRSTAYACPGDAARYDLTFFVVSNCSMLAGQVATGLVQLAGSSSEWKDYSVLPAMGSCAPHLCS